MCQCESESESESESISMSEKKKMCVCVSVNQNQNQNQFQCHRNPGVYKAQIASEVTKQVTFLVMDMYPSSEEIAVEVKMR